MFFFLNSADQQPRPSPARAAIVSVVIGETYENAWRLLCAGSWVSYAERIGADIIIYKDRIDKTDLSRSPAWQKLLILNQAWAQRYERIIWLDCDIIISDGAPNILEFAGPPEKVSLCVDGARMSPVEAQVYLERMNNTTLSPAAFGAAWGQAQREVYLMNDAPPHDVNFNTGVMVLSPRHHNELLLSVYGCPEKTHLYEQPHLSHRLLENDLAFVISPRFNWGVIESIQILVQGNTKHNDDPDFLGEIVHFLICSELRNAYFLHFYSAMNLLKLYADKVAAEQAAVASAA